MLIIVARIKMKPIVGLGVMTNIFPPLNYIAYIYYLVHFKKDHDKTQTLINSNNKVNTIT